MCDPTMLGIASLAMGALSSFQQIGQANDQAKYEKAVQKNNNIMAERASEDALRRGKREESLRRMQTTQDVGTQKSKIAGGGFDVNTGSALQKQSDIYAMGDVEALTIRSNAQREAYGINTNNARERAESAGRVSALKNQASSAMIGGVTSLVGGAYQMNKQGVFGNFGGSSGRRLTPAPVSSIRL